MRLDAFLRVIGEKDLAATSKLLGLAYHPGSSWSPNGEPGVRPGSRVVWVWATDYMECDDAAIPLRKLLEEFSSRQEKLALLRTTGRRIEIGVAGYFDPDEVPGVALDGELLSAAASIADLVGFEFFLPADVVEALVPDDADE